MKILACLSIIVLFAISAFCQASAPSPKTDPAAEANAGVHFEISSAYLKDSNGRQATVVLARLPITDNTSLGYEQIQIPSADSQVYLGGFEYREKLGHLIKTKAKFDLNQLQVYGQFGLGTKRDNSGNGPRFAYGVKGGVDFPLGTVGGGTLAAGASIGYIGVPSNPGGPNRFVFGNSVQIAPQLSLRF